MATGSRGSAVPARNDPIQVNIRIICITPSAVDENVTFGLQDKAQNLLPGQTRADGAFQFECQLEARRTAGLAQPNWFGAYVHGTPQQRFLYLSLGAHGGDGWNWIRRIKVPLSPITWAQIESAAGNQGVLEATVDGQKSGTVALIGDGWVIR